MKSKNKYLKLLVDFGTTNSIFYLKNSNLLAGSGWTNKSTM